MDVLLTEIQEALKRSKQHEQLLRQSEALTRYALIDPLLRALGWNTEDPSKLQPEFSTKTGVPDYALMWLDNPLVMIEAKKLGEDLDKHSDRGFDYCWKNGIKFFALTDGIKWKLYDVEPLGGENILELRINEYNVGEAARKLLALWYPAMPNIETAEEPLADGSFNKQASPSRPDKEAVSISSINEKWKNDKKPSLPNGIQFPDGNRQQINYWKDILVNTASWALPKLEGKIPLSAGPRRWLINTEAIHKDGQPFKTPKAIGDFWIETHYSGADAVSKAIKIIESANLAAEDFQLEYN